MDKDLIYLDTYVLQKDMRIRLPKSVLKNMKIEKGITKFQIYYDKINERQSHRQHIPNVGKQMFKQQLALVETLEKWIIDFENSLKGQN